MAPDELKLAQAVFMHEQLLIAYRPYGEENKEHPRESNAFGAQHYKTKV